MSDNVDWVYSPDVLEAQGKDFVRRMGGVTTYGLNSGVGVKLIYDAQDDTLHSKRIQDVTATLEHCARLRKESARMRTAGLKGYVVQDFILPVTVLDEIRATYNIDPNDDDDYDRLKSIVYRDYPYFRCTDYTV